MPNRDLARGNPQDGLRPKDPGWQLEPVSNGGPRGMVIEGGNPGTKSGLQTIRAFPKANQLFVIYDLELTSYPICLYRQIVDDCHPQRKVKIMGEALSSQLKQLAQSDRSGTLAYGKQTTGSGEALALALLKGTSDGIYLLEIDGRVTYLNDIARTHHIGSGDPVDQKMRDSAIYIWDVWPGLHKAALLGALDDVAAGEQVTLALDRNAMGLSFAKEAILIPIEDDDGDIGKAICICR